MMTLKIHARLIGFCAAAAVMAVPATASAQYTTFAATAQSTQVRQTPAEPTKIVFLGDSLTAGYGLPRAQAWPEQVQKRLETAGYNIDIINAGVSGNNTGNGLARYDRSVRSQNADILVIALGANDFFQGVSPVRTRRNLEAIIQRAKRDGLQVILAGVSSPQIARLGSIGRAYGSIYPDLARDYNLPLFPSIVDGVFGHANLVQRDGLHPNQAGASLMADNFTPFLSEILEK